MLSFFLLTTGVNAPAFTLEYTEYTEREGTNLWCNLSFVRYNYTLDIQEHI
jgi:hypothetical protein